MKADFNDRPMPDRFKLPLFFAHKQVQLGLICVKSLLLR
ncbi:hypothetical protein LBWT_X2380 (plasmid) [Leptolyngbya boryana IAM M-101]|nr:hypothetical protein LBWT_X2380 [Leptolyngbya boryana IAM M-101]BAS66514.1 hypothetical protein LBDG_X2380 [Leptolyngbya boryana dg5]